MTESQSGSDEAMAEAGAWLARLARDDASADDGLVFDAWLAAAPQNRSAYRRALVLWHEFDLRADDVRARVALTAKPPAARRSAGRLRPRPSARTWWIGGAAAALAAGLAIAVLPPALIRPTVQTYATLKGQHQRVALADGSIVDLDAETRLRVILRGSERRVSLTEGQAIFDVVHDARRPFVVQAGDRLVRDVGTQFDVRKRGAEITVTVARGRVEVTSDPAGAGDGSVLLGPGQRLEMDATRASQLTSVDPQETFSWRAGRLVYRAQPLAEVVADLNHQFIEQTTIADPQLARLPITGVIVLDNPRAVMARLSLMLPIKTVRSDKGLMLLRK